MASRPEDRSSIFSGQHTVLAREISELSKHPLTNQERIEIAASMGLKTGSLMDEDASSRHTGLTVNILELELRARNQQIQTEIARRDQHAQGEEHRKEARQSKGITSENLGKARIFLSGLAKEEGMGVRLSVVGERVFLDFDSERDLRRFADPTEGIMHDFKQAAQQDFACAPSIKGRPNSMASTVSHISE